MSAGPDCEHCPRRDFDDGYCEECTKNWWHIQNIKRCQYAYEREHGSRYPEMEKRSANSGCTSRRSDGTARERKAKSKRMIPAEFKRQREREKEIQRKMESFELTAEQRAARNEGIELLKAAIFG